MLRLGSTTSSSRRTVARSARRALLPAARQGPRYRNQDIRTKRMRRNSEHGEKNNAAGASRCICDGHVGLARIIPAFIGSTDLVKLTSAGMTAVEKLRALDYAHRFHV